MLEGILITAIAVIGACRVNKHADDFLARREKKNSPPPFYIRHDSIGDRYVGQDEFVRAMEVAFQTEKTLAISAVGIGGAGKTRFAAEFAHKNKDKYPGGCLWVPSETKKGDPGPVIYSLAQLEFHLGLNLPHDMPDDQQAAVVMEVLGKENRRALVVLDNAITGAPSAIW